MKWRLLALLTIAILSAPFADVRSSSAQATCTFTLGFATLRDMIIAQFGDIVGACLENEHHNPLNGDGLQQTTGGLMVWRKSDNWTAFTDGTTTYLNGPTGLAVRPNAGPLFPWENPAPAPAAEPTFVIPPTATPVPPAAPPPATPTPVPSDAKPTTTLKLDDTSVTAGDTIRITVTGTDDKGVATLVWYATDTSDDNLKNTHTQDCGGATPCRYTFETSTQDTGTITIHAYSIDTAGQHSDEVTEDVKVRAAKTPTPAPTATPTPAH